MNLSSINTVITTPRNGKNVCRRLRMPSSRWWHWPRRPPNDCWKMDSMLVCLKRWLSSCYRPSVVGKLIHVEYPPHKIRPQQKVRPAKTSATAEFPSAEILRGRTSMINSNEFRNETNIPSSLAQWRHIHPSPIIIMACLPFVCVFPAAVQSFLL